jgi:hypothetical protein
VLGTVNPLGERTRNSSWGVTILLYVVASAAGGAGVGAAAGTIGAVVRTPDVSESTSLTTFAAILVIGLVLDLRVTGLVLPSVRRQVNDQWLYEFRRWVYAFGFGLQLGAGALTIVKSSLVYASIAASLLAGTPEAGVLLGGTFGAVRGMTGLFAYWVRTPHDLDVLDRALTRLESRATMTARVSQLGLSIAAVVIAVS